ncbi:MAG: urate hydroxylase PuuD, partial [Pseudomonadota bacterium]
TIMSANVFFIIIPNQTIVVADLKAGRVPDPKYGVIAKQRSTHNNYLTLPVIFLMLSTHYPLAFASQWNWLIAALVFLMGVTIRHYFNSLHASPPPKRGPVWTWGATAALFLVIVALSTPPLYDDADWEEQAMSPAAQRFAAAEGFSDAYDIVQGRCSMCHAPEPGWGTLMRPPGGLILVSESAVATHARDIYLQSGVTHAMPPGNVSYMEPAERAAIVSWYRSVTGG